VVIGKGLVHFNAEQRAAVVSRAGEMMARFGYSYEAATESLGVAEARHHHNTETVTSPWQVLGNAAMRMGATEDRAPKLIFDPKLTLMGGLDDDQC
jgi:hypothetical protein